MAKASGENAEGKVLRPTPALVAIPEPFAGANRLSQFASVADSPAVLPPELYGRAMARSQIGREEDARADFLAAESWLGDWCTVEIAHLNIRQRRDIQLALTTSREIIRRSPSDSLLRARACHVAGLAEGKLRRNALSIDLLTKSVRLYRHLKDQAASLGLGSAAAQVCDTLGSVEAARGRLDLALHSYAMSLVDKSLAGDHAGMAVTLGNIGRANLRLGRFDDALECFGRDLAISREIGDVRGQARMYDDIGRTHLAAENWPEAEFALNKCLEIAEPRKFNDFAFFAHKDLALLQIAQRKFDQASESLALAELALPDGAEPYLKHVLTAARGELALAQELPEASSLLEQAVNAFTDADLPDLEIPARILLARAMLAQKFKSTARDCLLIGMQRARTDGYARYLPLLKQEMTRLDLTEGIIEEKPRPITDRPGTDDGYVIIERLGGGSFGEVFRAYDPLRACDVALKRFHLSQMYDTYRRKVVISSAKLELEAASRVRHPGVVKIRAVGFDDHGELYLVSDFLQGDTLRAYMPPRILQPGEIVRFLEKIADALHALHEGGVIHRDMKPENVLVTPAGMPVLVDFGIAHLVKSKGDPGTTGIAGTAEYMAPEQAKGAAADARTDIYALGVIAYEWFSGSLPIHPHAIQLRELAIELANTPSTPLAKLCPDSDPDLVKFIMSMLAKDPAKRPATADRVADKFRAFAQKMPIESVGNSASGFFAKE